MKDKKLRRILDEAGIIRYDGLPFEDPRLSVFYENNVKQNSAILNERGKDIFDIYQMLNAICKTLNITIILFSLSIHRHIINSVKLNKGHSPKGLR